ncbi:MAG: DEAD/DEAH box helicase [Candidatus Limisoma sp.]
MAKRGRKARSNGVSNSVKRVSETQKPSNMTLQQWQIALRRQAASREGFDISAVDIKRAPGEFRVCNSSTRQNYKVVYRGDGSPWNYCSCLDFKTSRLGTCKHIEKLKMWLEEHPSFAVRGKLPSYTSVYLSYRGEREVKIRLGEECREQFEALAARYFDDDGVLRADCFDVFPKFLDEALAISSTFRCYPDALNYVIEMRESALRRSIADGMTDDELDGILNTRLFPYQKEGVKFAFAKGRALIADEMGLGKTVQAIGAAELLRRNRFAESVLVVCPTSLKYQWKSEIERFTGADVLIVEGVATKRAQMYGEPATYKIVSYHTMANDVRYLGHIEVDMVIMDEVQRLKNWNTIIAGAARRVDARYVVALSGTPLENKLEEFYSVMELVDQYCLGPYYEFREKCIVTDGTSKVVGYKNLNSIGEQASSRLIRRRKADVALQLPKRSDMNLLVAVTPQQMDVHNENKETVARLIYKWRRQHFLSESDRRRLLLCLNIMRMVSDSTYVLDQTTRHDVKIDEAMNILDQMLQSGDGKAVVFSQWERMARLLAQELERRGVEHEFLHGGVPSHKRGAMTERFQSDPECRVFLSTDAGSTGLNLQSASLIINLDLPWNPAVLEQRIGRIYRYGQQSNVQVINLVSKGTIEEQMIDKLRFKQDMFSGVLDNGEDAIFVDEDRFKKIIEVFDNLVDDETGETDATHTTKETTSAAPETDDRTEKPRRADAMPPDPVDDEFYDDDEDDYYDDYYNDYNCYYDFDDDDDYDEEDISDGYYDCIDDFDTSDDDESADSAADEKTQPSQPDNAGTTAATSSVGSTPVEPQELVAQGLSFFSGLAQTLQSPEATKHLVDSIVRTDPKTGATSLNIPVPSKETVEQVLSMFFKLFQSPK